MGTELPTKVMLGQTLDLMQMTFLNNVRKVGRLVLSRTSCFTSVEMAVTNKHLSSVALFSQSCCLQDENCEDILSSLWLI
jgi:hypothetical protein